jgi:histone deacetylase 1/2
MAASTSKLTVRAALNSPDRAQWEKAIRDEIFSLLNTTESLLPEEIDTSKPYHLIHATMQLKKKMKDAQTLDKFKARCCACGNELLGMILDTYSPTVSTLAHSVLHQIAVLDGMETCLMDTVAAYLNQAYPEDATPLYLQLPRAVAEVCGLDPNQVYRIKKYLYGLPDAGRAYYLAYREHLLQNGYAPTASDPCLFVRLTDKETTYIWFHVDDTFVASNAKEGIDRLTRVMQKRFQVTLNEDVDSHLGVNMERLPDGSVKLTQKKLLHHIFEEYFPEEVKGVRGISVPARSTAPAPDDDEPVLQRDYLRLLGMLNYLTRSRPDIATALSFAATHSSNPLQSNFDQLLLVVRYLWDTRDKSLIIRRGNGPDSPLILTCYVDASYLTHPDSRSHTGYCMSFGTTGTFYAKSVKQQLVATSSTHAEVRALYQLIVDIIYIVNLCDELHRPVQLPAIIMEDNQPAIDLTTSLTGRIKKCKHFLMLISFIREQVAEGLISIQKVPTEDNYADLLTKILTGLAFQDKAEYLLGTQED